MKCDRCQKETSIFQMSRFNTDNCCPACLTLERMHPLYRAACKAEADAVARGDYNFPGIGLPEDLKRK